MYVCMHACMMYVCMNAWMHACMHTLMHVMQCSAHVHVMQCNGCACMYVRIYVRRYVCMSVQPEVQRD